MLEIVEVNMFNEKDGLLSNICFHEVQYFLSHFPGFCDCKNILITIKNVFLNFSAFQIFVPATKLACFTYKTCGKLGT